MTIINETYYGKNPMLLECEAAFQEMKDLLKQGKTPNDSAASKKLERNIAQLFGFENARYKLLPNNISGNSFTTPFYWDYSKNYKDSFFDLVKDKNGIRFKNPKGKTIFIYLYNECLRNMTNEELVAIMLHEIGHNFFLVKEQINYSKQFLLNSLTLEILDYIRARGYSKQAYKDAFEIMTKFSLRISKEGLTTVYYDELKSEFSKKKQNESNQRYDKIENTTVYRVYYLAWKLIGTFMALPFHFIEILLLPLIMSYRYIYCKSQTRSSLWKEKFRVEQNYNNEKFADAFTATYGYGAGTVSVFSNTEKFSYTKNNVDQNIPIFRVWWYYTDCMDRYIWAFSDEHPDDVGRCLFLIEKLEYELNNNKELDASQINEIKHQTAIMKETLKNRAYYRKGIDAIFAPGWDIKDKAASIKYSKEDIFNFDKELLKDKVSK